jgi:hypothetical protein
MSSMMSPDEDDNDNGDDSESIDDNCSYLTKDLLLEVDGSMAQNLDNTKT